MNAYSALRAGNETYITKTTPEAPLENGIYRYIPTTLQKPAHLVDFKNFSLPSKIYGEPLDKLTNKVKSCFDKFNKSVGILLSGEKGTGKSLQLKHLGLNCGLPAIVIDQPVPGAELLTLLETVPNSVALLFDEYEKVYNTEELQNSMLPVLDGVSTNRHIFVFTVNGEVSEYLIGRPSRIRYNVEYGSLNKEFVQDVVDDLCEVEDKKEDLVNLLMMFDPLNIDTVISLVNEVNLFKEEPLAEITKIFNLDNPFDKEFVLEFAIPGIIIEKSYKNDDFSKIYFEVESIIQGLQRPEFSKLGGALDNYESYLEFLKEVEPELKRFKGSVLVDIVHFDVNDFHLNDISDRTHYWDPSRSFRGKIGFEPYLRTEYDIVFSSSNLSLKNEGGRFNIYLDGNKIAVAKQQSRPKYNRSNL